MLFLLVKTVLYKGSAVVNTSEHCDVCEVILEILKIYCMGIKICQDPALLLCHNT